jgi:AraC family transcriptional regulator
VLSASVTVGYVAPSRSLPFTRVLADRPALWRHFGDGRLVGRAAAAAAASSFKAARSPVRVVRCVWYDYGSMSTSRSSGVLDPASYAPEISVVTLPGARLLRTTHSRGQRVPLHSHRRSTLTLVLSGRFVEVVGNRSGVLAPLDLIVKHGAVEHANHYPEGATCFVIELGRDLEERALPRCQPMTGLPSALALSLLDDAFTRRLTTFELEDGVARLVAAVTGSRPFRRGIVPRWLELIRERIWDDAVRRPTLAELSALAGVHPSHLCRAFSAHFGCTIGASSRQARIGAAARRLTSTDDPIAIVAADFGYADQAHLTRELCRHVGRPPARLRRLVRTLTNANTVQD